MTFVTFEKSALKPVKMWHLCFLIKEGTPSDFCCDNCEILFPKFVEGLWRLRESYAFLYIELKVAIHLATCVSICISHAAIIKPLFWCKPTTSFIYVITIIVYFSLPTTPHTSQENANITRILYWSTNSTFFRTLEIWVQIPTKEVPKKTIGMVGYRTPPWYPNGVSDPKVVEEIKSFGHFSIFSLLAAPQKQA